MKRFLSIATALTLILSINLQPVSAKSILTWSSSQALMDLNNSTIKKLKESKQQAWENYSKNAEQAKYINTEGMTFEFEGEKFYYAYDSSTQMAMKMQKELVPEQMKYSWEMTRDNFEITRNTLSNGLRGIFFMLSDSYSSMNISQKKLEAAQDANKSDKYKYGKGMITQLELEESDYSLEKAKKATEAVKRNYDNALRNFYKFSGTASDVSFDEIDSDENAMVFDPKGDEYFISKAIENRLEIKQLKTQISLKEQEMKLLEFKDLNKIDIDIQNNHDEIIKDIERLKLELDRAEQSIRLEIKGAYAEIANTRGMLEGLERKLMLQKKNLASMKMRYDRGYISLSVYRQAEIGCTELEKSYKAAVYNYNTRNTNFNNACNLGPAYQKGGF